MKENNCKKGEELDNRGWRGRQQKEERKTEKGGGEHGIEKDRWRR